MKTISHSTKQEIASLRKIVKHLPLVNGRREFSENVKTKAIQLIDAMPSKVELARQLGMPSWRIYEWHTKYRKNLRKEKREANVEVFQADDLKKSVSSNYKMIQGEKRQVELSIDDVVIRIEWSRS